MPIGAVLTSDKCESTFSYSDHGSTFGGNPLCTAVANVVVNEINDYFLQNIQIKSNFLMSKLQNINSPYIKEVRGLGLMIGIELEGKLNTQVQEFTQNHGILVLTAGKNTIRLLPPLTISYDEINICVEVLQTALEGDN